MAVTTEDNVLRIIQGQVLVEWKIKKFFDLPEESLYSLESPTFDVFGTQLDLRIYPNGGSIYLNRTNIGYKSGIAYTVGIKKADGSVFKSLDGKQLPWKGIYFNFPTCLTELNLNFKDVVAPDGILRVFLTARLVNDDDDADSMEAVTPLSKHEVNEYEGKIKDLEEKLSASRGEKDDAVDKSEKKIKDLDEKLSASRKEKDAAVDKCKELENSVEILSANFKELLLSEYQADFTITVKDKEYKVHKTVLSARSRAFRAMLEADMLEKNSGAVNIEDCEPSIFEDFLLFLYSGKCSVVSSSNALGLFSIADKYDLPDLKQASLRCLSREVSTDSVCDVVQLAVLHHESDLLETATEYFVDHVDEVLKTQKWQSFFLENPAIANELLLKMVNKYKK